MKMVKFAAVMAGLLLVTQVFADEQKFENLNQYFEYLPNAVHKNWTPYKPTVIMKFLCNLELRRMEKLQILLL